MLGLRWLLRSTYGIQSDVSEDCLASLLCPCCSANQLYQTSKARGNPTPDGGILHNTGVFKSELGSGSASTCLYTFCCMPCAKGTMLEKSVSSNNVPTLCPYWHSFYAKWFQMGMPFIIGCCCVNVCATRNLLRYQYRIRGNDFLEDLVVPLSLSCVGSTLGGLFAPLRCLPYAFYTVVGMQLFEEIRLREDDAALTAASTRGGLNANPQEVFTDVLNFGREATSSASGYTLVNSTPNVQQRQRFYLSSPPPSSTISSSSVHAPVVAVPVPQSVELTSRFPRPAQDSSSLAIVYGVPVNMAPGNFSRGDDNWYYNYTWRLFYCKIMHHAIMHQLFKSENNHILCNK
jgi:hypothetical protein